MIADKTLKAALIFLGACLGAVVAQNYYPEAVKAHAAVGAAGCAALLAYLLNPKGNQEPQEVKVTNTPAEPVPTDPQTEYVKLADSKETP